MFGSVSRLNSPSRRLRGTFLSTSPKVFFRLICGDPDAASHQQCEIASKRDFQEIHGAAWKTILEEMAENTGTSQSVLSHTFLSKSVRESAAGIPMNHRWEDSAERHGSECPAFGSRCLEFVE